MPKITELPQTLTIAAGDMLAVVSNPGSTPVTNRIAFSDFSASFGGGSSVASIAALRALPPGARTGAVNVLGYYAAGDGGGGQFYWASASVVADDAGLTILPTGLAGAGRWVRIIATNAFNPRWFGVKLDGTTDDSSAWATSITAVTAAGGGLIEVPAGVTCISAMLTIPGLINLSGTGGGLANSDATTRFKCTTSAAGLTFGNSGGFARNFAVDGNSVALVGLTIDATSSGKMFDNIDVYRCQDNWFIGQCQNFTFVGCQSQYASRDNLVIDKEAGGHTFVRFESYNPGRYAISMKQSRVSVGGYTQPTHIRFLHCLFEYLTTDNETMNLQSQSNVLFDQCVVTGTNAVTPTAPVVNILVGDAFFSDCSFLAGNPTIFKIAAGASMNIAGGSCSSGVTQIFDVLGGVNVISPPSIGTSPWRKTAQTDYFISSTIRQALFAFRPAGSTVIASQVVGESSQRLSIDGNGSYLIGDGSSGAATGISRAANAGELVLNWPSASAQSGVVLNPNGPTIFVNAGSPEGTVYGAKGSIYHRNDGDASNSVYIKTGSGPGSNTGWTRIQTDALVQAQTGVTGAVVQFSCAFPVHSAALVGNVTGWSITGTPVTGQEIEVAWVQDATGSRTLAGAAANIKHAGGALTLTTTAAKSDTVRFRYNGTNWMEISRSMNV